MREQATSIAISRRISLQDPQYQRGIAGGRNLRNNSIAEDKQEAVHDFHHLAMSEALMACRIGFSSACDEL